MLMMRDMIAAVLAVGLTSTLSMSAAHADAVLDCARNRDPAARMKACGDVIKGAEFASE